MGRSPSYSPETPEGASPSSVGGPDFGRLTERERAGLLNRGLDKPSTGSIPVPSAKYTDIHTAFRCQNCGEWTRYPRKDIGMHQFVWACTKCQEAEKALKALANEQQHDPFSERW